MHVASTGLGMIPKQGERLEYCSLICSDRQDEEDGPMESAEKAKYQLIEH